MQTLFLTEGEIAAWLRLTTTPGISRTLARQLLAALGIPQNIFEAPYSALCTIAGHEVAAVLQQGPPPEFAQRIAATLAWQKQAECHLVTLADPAYPPMLLDTADPPTLLYVRGRLQLLHTPALAIVGSRHASAQGLANARAFAATCASAGLTIVSGMALGIDGAAHEGALAAGGGTVAVVGTGVNRVYPARHGALAQRLAQHGALISEWPLDTPPRPGHFPQRNRLIAGLARGVLVVEAAAQSGSLITARLANEMGRDVFAIPGSIHSALTKGCHYLIKEGAKLVESAEEVLEDLGRPAGPPIACTETAPRDKPLKARKLGLGFASDNGIDKDRLPPSARPHATQRLKAPAAKLPLDADALAVLRALGHDAAAPDLLAERTGLSAARLQAALLNLEMTERIALMPCGRIAPHFGHDAQTSAQLDIDIGRNPIEPR